MRDDAAELTAAELVVAIPIALVSAIIITAHVIDAAGWPIDPTSTLLVVAVQGVLAAVFLAGRARSVVRSDVPGLAGCLAIIAGFFTYILWLARPDFLPLNQSSDMVHHVSLIDFIGQHRVLVHDASLSRYLGELAIYPSGSHVLAAIVAGLAGTTGLEVLHPLLAVLVGVKAAVVYNIILRILPPERRASGVAAAATVLLLFAWRYFLLSFIDEYFYAQVVAETFAVAMLWSLVAWWQSVSRDDETRALLMFAVSGLATLTTWPVWLPVPLAAFLILLAARWRAFAQDGWRWLATAFGPVLVFGVPYSAGMRGGQRLLTAEGHALAPTVEMFGYLLLTLAAIGLGLSITNRRAWPILAFALAVAVQTTGLFVFDRYHGVKSYYLAYKMMHLALYPMVILAGVALGWLAAVSAKMLGGGRVAFRVVAAGFLLVLASSRLRNLPTHPYTAITTPAYEAGLWARTNVPRGCVDYLVEHWVTAYWLHVDVLGNPRATARTEDIVNNYKRRSVSPDKWSNPYDLPFAIVTDLAAAPPGVRAGFKVLYEWGPAAVVERATSAPCDDASVPLDRVEVAARNDTVAAMLRRLFMW